MTTRHARLPRRRIVTDEQDPDDAAHVISTEQEIPAGGDVHDVATVEQEVADTAAALARLDALVEPLRAELGFQRFDAIASAVNALVVAVRHEAIARMVTAAAGMADWSIGLFVLPPVEDGEGD